jgi:hypothetical protein
MSSLYTLPGGTSVFRILEILPRQMSLIEDVETGHVTRVMIAALQPVKSGGKYYEQGRTPGLHEDGIRNGHGKV